MTITQAILLGIVEGLTEFLPVSSTGHLIVFSSLMDLEPTEFLKTFEIFIQVGAILAVLPLFIRRVKRSPKRALNILAAFIPTALAGALLYPMVKRFLEYPSLVAWALLIGGLIMLAIELRLKKQVATEDDFRLRRSISLKDSILLGTYQAFALIPGVSRSGSTIIGGLMHRIDRAAIVEFSFVLSVPTIFAASAYDLMKMQISLSGMEMLLLAVGFLASWMSAFFCVRMFIRFVSSHTFIPFAVYRIIAGVILLVFFF
jgi:undecaprenyl-diphosphatase